MANKNKKNHCCITVSYILHILYGDIKTVLNPTDIRFLTD